MRIDFGTDGGIIVATNSDVEKRDTEGIDTKRRDVERTNMEEREVEESDMEERNVLDEIEASDNGIFKPCCGNPSA